MSPQQKDSLRSDPTWATTDITLGAFLQLRGLQARGFITSSEDPSKLAVVFDRSPAIDAALAEWESGEADELRRFAAIHNETYRALKTSLRSLLPRKGATR